MNIDYIEQGDCLELMKAIPDKSVDLIICDLPYGLTQNKNDIVIPFDPLWKQYERVAKDHAAICLFGQGRFFIDLVDSKRELYRYDLVWDKELVTGFLNANRMPLRRHEQIAVFYKCLPVYHPQFTHGRPLHSKGTAYRQSPGKNRNYGFFEQTDDIRAGSTEKHPTSILRFAKPHPSLAVHPTQKPFELLKYLIRTYSDAGALVLDNCMGSGSTCVAAINTGRHYIGFELNPNYYEIAKKRIEETKQ